MTVSHNEAPGPSTLEEMVGAEKFAELTDNVEKIWCETYQPILGSVLDRTGNQNMKVELVATAKLILKQEDGNPVVENNVSFDLKFSPERTYDMFEQVQRDIVRMLFVKVVEK